MKPAFIKVGFCVINGRNYYMVTCGTEKPVVPKIDRIKERIMTNRTWTITTIRISLFVFLISTIIFLPIQKVEIKADSLPGVISTIQLPAGAHPYAVAVNEVTNKIYVTDDATNTVTVINGENNTIAATLSVGTFPVGLQVNSATNRIYVANRNSNTVSVINGSKDTIVATVNVGNLPTRLRINSLNNRIYVTNDGDQSISFIDGNTNTVDATANLETPQGFGSVPGFEINRNTNRIYAATAFPTNSIWVIDGITGTVINTIGTDDRLMGPPGIGVDPNSNRIYVSNMNPGISVIDGVANSQVATVNVGFSSSSIRPQVDSGLNRIWAATNNIINAINGSTNSITGTINIGDQVSNIKVNDANHHVFATGVNNNIVSVIDGNSNSLLTTVSIGYGRGSGGLTINTVTNRVYVTNHSDGTVSVIQDSSQASSPGTLDPTFGSGGTLLSNIANYNDFATAVVIQEDGKIIVAGCTNTGTGGQHNFALARYSVNGSLDPTFGNEGKVVTDFSGDAVALAVEEQQDGKIVVGGVYVGINGLGSWLLARYNAEGLIDSTFGNGGKVILTFNGYSRCGLYGLTIQDDGKIVGVGYGYGRVQGYYGAKDDVLLARFNIDGSFDTNFGSGGQVFTPIGTINDRGYRVAIRPDGRLVVFGDYDAGYQDNIFLVQYNVNGTLDPGFGNGGKVTASIGNYDRARDLVFQPDGKIVVTGGTDVAGRKELYVARFDANGMPDTGFGTGSKVIAALASGNSNANTIVLMSDGRILIGGSASQSTIIDAPASFYVADGTNSDFAVACLNSNGTFDSSFGIDGKVLTHIGTGWATGMDMKIQSDGNGVIVGTAFNGSDFDFVIARYFLGMGSSLSTSTDITSSFNPSVFGQPISYTAIVNPSTATGTVQFSIDGLYVPCIYDPVPLVNGSAVSGAFNSLTPGSYSVTATYSGDSAHNPSTGALTQTVSKAPVKVTLTSSIYPWIGGQPVSLTATVTPELPETILPTGTVTFQDGMTTLGSINLDSNGQAAFSFSPSAGTHTLLATYNGDANYLRDTGFISSNGPDQQIVVKASVNTQLEALDIFRQGQPIRFKAILSPAFPATASPNGGAVQFYVDNILKGSSDVSNGAAVSPALTLTYTDHDIKAVYSGDSNYWGSTGHYHLGTGYSVSFGLTSSANPAFYSQPVRFTYRVVVTPPAYTPTGTVQFKIGDTLLGSPVPITDGLAFSDAVSNLDLGSHTVSAEYTYSQFPVSLEQTIIKIPTWTSLTSNPYPGNPGSPVTLTAAVTAPSQATISPTGAVQFKLDNVDLGAVTVVNGIATFNTTIPVSGFNTISAIYAPDTEHFLSSSASLSQPVIPLPLTPTILQLSSSNNPSNYGDGVTLTATVSKQPPASGIPDGTVRFLDNGASLGEGTLDPSGKATLPISSLKIGRHNIVAVYTGNSECSSSSGSLTQSVNAQSPIATQTNLTSSVNPSVYSQPVSFTATVVSSRQDITLPPTGTVTFTDTFNNNTTTLAVIGLNSSGMAAYTTSSLGVGSHNIVAVYNPDTTNFLGSAGSLSQTSGPGSPTVGMNILPVDKWGLVMPWIVTSVVFAVFAIYWLIWRRRLNLRIKRD